MQLLVTTLLILIPLTVSAESRGGVTVGPSTAPHAAGTYGFGMHGLENRIPGSRFPLVRGFHGRAIRPLIHPAPDQNFTIISVQVEPEEELPPPPPKTPAPAKFWTARCGSFVELEAGPTLNLMEEEKKGCPD